MKKLIDGLFYCASDVAVAALLIAFWSLPVVAAAYIFKWVLGL